MKALTSTKQVKFLAYVVLIIWTAQGCEKEDEQPDYVGTWATVQTQDSTNSGTVNLRDVVDFSAKSFTHLGQVLSSQTNEWINFIGVKGKITIDDNIMSIKIVEMGVSQFNLFTGLPTGTIYYYRQDQAEFTNILKDSQISQYYQSKFQISGNKLILWTDKNGDSDYDDENEETTFFRQ
jgi:hypothetical protein